MTIQKKLFDFFLFSSLFIAICAIVMVYQSYTLLVQKPVNYNYLAFVFFSTVSSYNFHWLFTNSSINPSFRLHWSFQHKGYHFILFLCGLFLSLYFFFYLTKDWLWIGMAGVLTFLYSAPKISLAPFQWLKKFAMGKTVFLAMMWTFVTVALPFIIERIAWTEKSILFCTGQFFFIFSICILFDYRDRQDDLLEGIRSTITYFSEKGINILFRISIVLSAISYILLIREGIDWFNVIVLILPVMIISFLFNHAKNNFSDYLYYFVLDGLTMFAGLILWIMQRF